MGVPRLFPWIRNTFGRYVSLLPIGSRQADTVQHLYIDFNPLIHNSAQVVYGYGREPSMETMRYAKLSDEEKRLAIFQGVISRLKEVLGLITPTELLYIAIDGPAPLAKQAQQRQRRFESRINDINDDKISEGFNSTWISPGTEFMFELTKFLHLEIRKIADEMREMKNVSILFSSCRVPGEGEHKIMDFIRRKATPDTKACFCGPDGDLIMLTLATHMNNMRLLREDQEAPGNYYYIDMGRVYNELPRVLQVKNPQRSIKDVANDFILLGFFVGNDFLPRIRMFMYLERGLEQMISSYISSKATLTKDSKIMYENFTRFIRLIAKEEIPHLTHIALDVGGGRWAPKTAQVENANAVLRSCLDGDKLDFDKFRSIYYTKAFECVDSVNAPNPYEMIDATRDDHSRLDRDFDSRINQMCFAYIRTIHWVFSYYVSDVNPQPLPQDSWYPSSGCGVSRYCEPPSWKWFYPYFHAPLMTDLEKYMFSNDHIQLITFFAPTCPSPPFLQLLSILPAPSRGLLPEEYSHLYSDPDSPLRTSGYLLPPTKDYESAINEHTAIVVLPFVDPDVMEKIYDSVFLKLRYYRNEIDGVYLFRKDRKRPIRYKSDYGTVDKSFVSVTPFTLDVKGEAKSCFDWSDFLVNTRCPRLKFYHVPQEQRKNVHWGQLKLLMALIFPLLRIIDPRKLKKTHIVYAGAAPGKNIAIVSDLFPMITMDLYDPAPFAIKESPPSGKSKVKRISIYNQLFLDEDAERYTFENRVGGPLEKKHIFFVSDIRRQISTDQLLTERMIHEDMEMQQRWTEIIQPMEAWLKFRLPYKVKGIEHVIPTAPYVEYLDGENYFQVVPPRTSTEGRLRPMRNRNGNYVRKKWNFVENEGQMFYHNMVVRETFKYYNDDEEPSTEEWDGLFPPELVADWDSSGIALILKEYLKRFRRSKPLQYHVTDMYGDIVERLSGKSGITLGNIREGMKVKEEE